MVTRDDLEGRAPRSFDWAPGTGRAAGLLAEAPVRVEIEHPRWPSTGVVINRFRSWRNGLRAAGLPARIPDHEPSRGERVEAAVRLRAAGESVSVIADLLGVHSTTVCAYLNTGTGDGGGGRRWALSGVRHPGAEDPTFLEGSGASGASRLGKRDGHAKRLADGGLADGARWHEAYPRWPSAAAVKRLFGSWEEALRAAGFEPRLRRWTREAVTAALRADAAARGRPPRYCEWQSCTSDAHPDASTTAEMFGT